MSSLDPKDAIADYSSLNEAQMKTLDQWDSFFAKVCATLLVVCLSSPQLGTFRHPSCTLRHCYKLTGPCM